MVGSGATVELVGVSKTYRTRRGEQLFALAETSLSIKSGEFVTIVGPSGCGKTTLLSIVAGLIASSAGEVLVNGRPCTRKSTDVGVMFQEPTLLLWRTVLRNVLLPAEIAGLSSPALKLRAHELIDMLGLSGFENAYPHELSGGMQQRVAIARSLVLDSSLLLMDEPFSAIDAFTRERLALELLLIRDRNPKTVLFVTHNIGEAVFLADRLLVMGARPGRILEEIPVSLPRPRTSQTLIDASYHNCILSVRRVLQSTGSI